MTTTMGTAGRRRKKYLGAVDLGGSKILSLIADGDGHRLAEDLRPTGAQEGPEVVLARIQASLDSALAGAGIERGDLAAVGICSPGPCDVQAGVIPSAPNLPGWQDVPLCRYLEERLGVPVYLENDATAAALGEHVYGAGRGCRHLIYITVSTGIGGGIIIDGKLYTGATGAAGEIGHITLDPDGPLCGCGNRGCLEAFASGRAVATQGDALIAQGGSPLLARLAQEEGEVTAEAVCRAALAGDPEARRLIERAGYYLGIGFATYVNIFDPEMIIVGGGLSRAGDLLLGPARAEMKERAMPESLRVLRLELAELGDYSGAMGLVALLRERAPA
ncbi:MAG: ROK family protein [Chloroflexota bacterium]|nr:ROK family protein [Chloroflexota bacterium]